MNKNLTENDFEQDKTMGDWQKYKLNKTYVFWGRAFGKYPFIEETLELSIHKNNQFSGCIVPINDYLKWLNSDEFKNLLMNSFCEHINGYSDEKIAVKTLVANKWFDSLDLHRVLLTVGIKGKLSVNISCADNHNNGHILDIETFEDAISEISYDG